MVCGSSGCVTIQFITEAHILMRLCFMIVHSAAAFNILLFYLHSHGGATVTVVYLLQTVCNEIAKVFIMIKMIKPKTPLAN